MPSLKASKEGQAKIQLARKRKNWSVKETDTRPLKAASLFLLHELLRGQGWDANDAKFIKEFEYYFRPELRPEKPQTLSDLKAIILKAKQGSFLKQLEELIEGGEVLVKGISYGTWNRFATQGKVAPISEPAFKAYCHILELDWREVVEGEPESKTAGNSSLCYSFPNPDYQAFIGREKEIARLLELLAPESHASRISVEGCGGMGKTSLVLEAVSRCQVKGENHRKTWFDAIIFTSAKTQHFTEGLILPRLNRERTLRDIFRAVARALNCLEIASAHFEEQLELIKNCLGRQRTLLIVDNLETLAEQEAVLSFLLELPLTAKAVITSRIKTPFTAISLDCLPQGEGLHFIEKQAENKGVILSKTESDKLYEATGGVPAAIVYAIGQLASGYSLKNVWKRLSSPTGEVAKFYFEGSIQPLRGLLTHHLLMALAMFPKSAAREALIQTATTDNNDYIIEEHLAKLQQLSLIKCQQKRYQMLPLTREYVLNELKVNPDFEAAARERWVYWYLQYSQQHGGQDAKEWNNYEYLEAEWENLQEVIEWCIGQERYDQFLQFWQQVKGYSHAQGYNRDRLTYWSSRLDWTDWLIQAAKSRQDWPTAAEAMNDRAWTLTVMGEAKHLKIAEDLFNQTWQIRQHQTCKFQVNLAINIAVLRIHQQRFNQATYWLKKALNLLDNNCFKQLNTKHYFIQISYYQGKICFQIGDYDRAKLYFQETLAQAQEIGRQRSIALAKNWLGDVAVEQENFDEARQLFEEGLQIAKLYKDKSREAYCQESMAILAKKQGDLTASTHWANLSLESFTALGMLSDVQRMTAFIQNSSLSSCQS